MEDEPKFLIDTSSELSYHGPHLTSHVASTSSLASSRGDAPAVDQHHRKKNDTF